MKDNVNAIYALNTVILEKSSTNPRKSKIFFRTEIKKI